MLLLIFYLNTPPNLIAAKRGKKKDSEDMTNRSNVPVNDTDLTLSVLNCVYLDWT